MAMGSPLSPVIAKMFMEYIIDTARQKIKNQINLDLAEIYIYVDDIFCTIPSIHLDPIVNISFHHKIHFTFETEKNGSLSYMDMQLIRNQNQITTNWYHKPYSSNRLLNYNSEHSMQQKISILINLKNRIFTLSDDIYKHSNIRKFREICAQNDYPKHLIDQVLFRTSSHQKSESADNRPSFCKFPLIFHCQLNTKHS